ncbi:MAG: DUF6364 family protein [Chitinophagales bacterium]|nr:DUF6364 family protein [Chitinophagales bacterium]
MKAKLTLSVDRKTLERSKQYARQRSVSISKLIETYLNRLTRQEIKKSDSPITDSLTGIIKLPKGYDYKKDFAKHLAKKHL